MTFLSEDPTYLVGALVLISAACWMTLKVTQQGKYLVWALSTLGLALAVLVIEQVWVTDNERIEGVVYDLRQAVLEAKPDDLLAHLTLDVEYVHDSNILSGDATRTLIRANLANASFDFVHIHDLQTSAGRKTRRGKAEFRVYAKGSLRTPTTGYNIGTANSTWSLGFEETEPGIWKVNRITPVSMVEGIVWANPPSDGSKAQGHGRGNRHPGLGPFMPGRGYPKRSYSARPRDEATTTAPVTDDKNPKNQ